MTNWFSGISQAASGLDAARYGLSVVGQNMTNAATKGYVRQTVQQSAVDLGAVTTVRSGAGTQSGVSVTATDRSADAVLDSRVRTEHSRSQLASTTAAQLGDVESLLGEPSDSGLSAQLGDFWNAWGSVANDPSSGSAARTVLLGDAAKVAGTLNTMGDALAQVSDGVSANLAADVDALNNAAGSLATLNGTIAVGTATGANVNALLDQRDQLLDTLGTLSGATVTLAPSGAATVSIGGQTLVSGTTATAATVAGTGIAVGGQAVTVTAGSIGARSAALSTTLPAYRAALDSVADRLSQTVNAAQAGAYDATGAAGAAMFAGSGATGIHVVLADPQGVATTATPGTLDGGVAQALSQSGLGATSPDAAFSALVATVASASAAAQQQAATQSSVATTVDGLKSSMSGVSIDEEASQMLVYQQAFNASARVLTAMDDMLDTLINHTGTVGRA